MSAAASDLAARARLGHNLGAPMRAKPSARLGDVLVDRAPGNAQANGNLNGCQALTHQGKALTLTRS